MTMASSREGSGIDLDPESCCISPELLAKVDFSPSKLDPAFDIGMSEWLPQEYQERLYP